MKRLSDNVLHLGNRHFNYFLVGQKDSAIIECGVTGGVVSLKAQWPQLDRFTNRPKVRYLVAMHGHFDHVCGIPGLQGLFPQTMVLASREAQKVLSKPKIVDNFFYQDTKMIEVLNERGVIPELTESPQVNSIVVDQVIEEGEAIKLSDGLSIQVLAAPGHSPCSIAGYLPQEQVMFISDAAGFQISEEEIFPIFFQSYEIYRETIKRLMSFPTRILGVAHGMVITGNQIDTFYQRTLNAAESVFEEIQRKLDRGIDEANLAEELFLHYYRENLRIYTPENIRLCVDLLIRRVKEFLV